MESGERRAEGGCSEQAQDAYVPAHHRLSILGHGLEGVPDAGGSVGWGNALSAKRSPIPGQVPPGGLAAGYCCAGRRCVTRAARARDG